MKGHAQAPSVNDIRRLLAGLCLLSCWASSFQGQLADGQRSGALASKPLFRDPVFDGAADPAIVWNFGERKWQMFYTNRRAKLPDEQIDGVNWVHGTKIGIAQSTDGAQ